MRIRYFKDTDTLLIEFKEAPVAETRDLDENTVLDIDAQGNVCACEWLSKSDEIWRRFFFGPEKCFGGATKTAPRSRVKGRLRLYAAWRSEPLTRRRGNTIAHG